MQRPPDAFKEDTLDVAQQFLFPLFAMLTVPWMHQQPLKWVEPLDANGALQLQEYRYSLILQSFSCS